MQLGKTTTTTTTTNRAPPTNNYKQLQVKQLVYMYLTHYADQCQDLALLSINSFQKDLYDKNQLVRAMALRVMSAIHVPAIVQLLLMAVRLSVVVVVVSAPCLFL
jgi:vesicle coat complex subunit